MTSICGKRKTRFLTALYKHLKPQGYKRQSATFIRQPSPDFVQRVNVQMSAGNFWTDCRFYVSLGVYLPILHGGLIPSSLKEYQWDFQESLGNLAEGRGSEWYFPSNMNEIFRKVVDLFHQHGQPWLDRYSSYDSIWQEWETMDEAKQKPAFGTAGTMIKLLLALGEKDKGRLILQQQYDYNLTEMPRRSERMKQLADTHGIMLT